MVSIKESAKSAWDHTAKIHRLRTIALSFIFGVVTTGILFLAEKRFPNLPVASGTNYVQIVMVMGGRLSFLLGDVFFGELRLCSVSN